MQTVSFKILPEETEVQLAEMAFAQPEVHSTYKRYKSSDFALKVLGKEEYLMSNVPLIQYKVCIFIMLFWHSLMCCINC